MKICFREICPCPCVINAMLGLFFKTYFINDNNFLLTCYFTELNISEVRSEVLFSHGFPFIASIQRITSIQSKVILRTLVKYVQFLLRINSRIVFHFECSTLNSISYWTLLSTCTQILHRFLKNPYY